MDYIIWIKWYDSYRMKSNKKYHLFSRKLESPSRKEFLTQQRSAVPESDHKTFCSDVGMTEFGTLKNGIQWGWILFYGIRVPCILPRTTQDEPHGSLNRKKIIINNHKHPILSQQTAYVNKWKYKWSFLCFLLQFQVVWFFSYFVKKWKNGWSVYDKVCHFRAAFDCLIL